MDHQRPTLNKQIAQAIAHYWRTRQQQYERQLAQGRSDQGARSAVTGGSQMLGFCELITHLLIDAGIASGTPINQQEWNRSLQITAVLADAEFGDVTAFRRALRRWRLPYAVGSRVISGCFPVRRRSTSP